MAWTAHCHPLRRPNPQPARVHRPAVRHAFEVAQVPQSRLGVAGDALAHVDLVGRRQRVDQLVERVRVEGPGRESHGGLQQQARRLAVGVAYDAATLGVGRVAVDAEQPQCGAVDDRHVARGVAQVDRVVTGGTVEVDPVRVTRRHELVVVVAGALHPCAGRHRRRTRRERGDERVEIGGRGGVGGHHPMLQAEPDRVVVVRMEVDGSTRWSSRSPRTCRSPASAATAAGPTRSRRAWSTFAQRRRL